MEIRNAQYKNTENTMVDVEIEHPVYGWIPYTFKSDEPDESFDSEIREWLKTATIEAYVAPIIPEPTYDDKLREINAWYEAEVAKLTKGVPNTEISTWDKQESEARAYLVDVNASTPFIDSLIATRGVTKEYLVGKIIEKADAYAIAVGVLTGERQRREDELA